jgi:hypothetical protein
MMIMSHNFGMMVVQPPQLLLGKDIMKVTPIQIKILVLGLEQENSLNKITAEEAAKYLGMDESEMTPETCSKLYKKHGMRHIRLIQSITQ